MRVVVTRPQADGERTAAVLEALGHEVLVAPLMRIEPVAVDLAGTWSAIVITSANALQAAAAPGFKSLPVFAVGARSAEAARQMGFATVNAADGDTKDLARLIAARSAGAKAPLLYLAGADRAGDLVAELRTHGIRAELKIVYRAVAEPFPSVLAAVLEAGDVDAVLHFSRRSVDAYLSCSRDLLRDAVAPIHYCLSARAAEPLRLAGATRIHIAAKPDEASLLALIS